MTKTIKFVALAGVTVLVASSAISSAMAQSAAELKADVSTTENVLTLGMGYGQQRYSALDQINKKTVKRLVPVWNFSLNDGRGQESQPLIYKGVMYVTTHQATHAIEAKTGKQIWQHKIEYPAETPRIVCCGILNRGAAIYNGKLFRTTLDANVIAIDPAGGKELWRSNAASVKDSFSMTVAPLIADGVVITGVSGGEYGVRGFIDGWDPDTGRHLWRRYTTAAPGEKGGDTWPGDTYKHGGGTTWLTGSYDPELGLVYWGTGNGGPWNAEFRKGDNLYIASVLALRPKTGEIVWYYQFSPNSRYDHDGTNENILADVTIKGKKHKALMHADRNGYIYVIDRTNGKLLAANSFVDNMNWADGIDLKTGRPILSATTKKLQAGETVQIWPSFFGGKNWSPSSYNPGTGLVYLNALELGAVFAPIEPKFVKNAFYLGYDLGKAQMLYPKDGAHSYLRAVDPTTGKSKWRVANDVANWGGTMSTGGGLVFVGAQTGEFRAYDADNGKRLWQFQTGSGIIGQPITWQQDGRQYVSVASGTGGAYNIYMPLLGASNKELSAALGKMQPGGSIWTFALLEE